MPGTRVPHDLHVVSTETVTPHLTRVWFAPTGSTPSPPATAPTPT